jgi:hypothetical protein
VLLALAWGAAEGVGAARSVEAAGKPSSKVYRNERYGYEVRYPQAWFPSGVVYGNAFEIRNYPPRTPRVRSARNRATLLFLDMPMASPTEASGYLAGLLAQGSNQVRKVTALTIDGKRAVRMTQRLPEQVLGPGVAGSEPTKRVMALHIKTFVAKGAFVLQLWGVVRADARREVIAEVIGIENRVRFF